ncbi:Hypothetical protein D9617_15g042950 [Elsinoe fawcettii]|nr:Hypothetical protein D9617_15g042950 [Elsinoe fawcettii]
MATYTVQIKLAGTWAKSFSANKTRLCMAKGAKDDSGAEIFNVIAVTTEQPNITVTWTDEYQLGATTELFNDGAQIIGASDAKDISFGYTYDMRDWDDVAVIQDSQDIAKNQLGFRNAKKCSAVLSVKTKNGFTPIFISPGTLPPGKSKFTPLPKVAFWWQQAAKTATMINVFKGESLYVNPKADGTVNVTFNADGHWEQ